MKTDFTKMTLSLAAALMLSACSTLGGIGAAQGDVAGETDRISILELNETLQVSGTITPDQVTLPPVYANTDWPQVGGNPSHVVQHTGATGSFDRIWSKDTGKGSARKGRVVAPPVVAGGRIYTMDGSNRITAMDANSGDKIWDYKVALEEREKTRVGRVGVVERVRDPLSFFDGSGTDKESVGGGVAVADGKLFICPCILHQQPQADVSLRYLTIMSFLLLMPIRARSFGPIRVLLKAHVCSPRPAPLWWVIRLSQVLPRAS